MLQDIKNKLLEIGRKIAELKSLLRIEEKKKRVGELEASSSDPALWKNPEAAQRILRELKMTEYDVNKWEGLRSKCEELLSLTEASIKEDDGEIEGELKEELKNLEEEFSELEFKTLLSGEYDKNNAILTISAGAGGTDAQDWAAILLRMYTRYCENKNYEVELADVSYGEEAGVKSATLVISGPHAYGYLKEEKGVHRLVRMSPFNADGKRHTSFASIDVIPEMAGEVDVKINPADLRIDTFRASGPGGQHVNKTDSAIRITHIPTGIVSQSQSDRSQHANRDAAMKILKARIHERLLLERKEKIEELRGELKEIAWGSQIRSYVFQPYTLVKDHRTGVEVGNVQKVIDGDIDIFIEASLKNKKK